MREEKILYLPDVIEIVERGGVEYELCENKWYWNN